MSITERATVRIMRSWNYNHFEASLEVTAERATGLTKEDVSQTFKNAQELVDGQLRNHQNKQQAHQDWTEAQLAASEKKLDELRDLAREHRRLCSTQNEDPAAPEELRNIERRIIELLAPAYVATAEEYDPFADDESNPNAKAVKA